MRCFSDPVAEAGESVQQVLDPVPSFTLECRVWGRQSGIGIAESVGSVGRSAWARETRRLQVGEEEEERLSATVPAYQGEDEGWPSRQIRRTGYGVGLEGERRSRLPVAVRPSCRGDRGLGNDRRCQPLRDGFTRAVDASSGLPSGSKVLQMSSLHCMACIPWVGHEWHHSHGW
ncbi:unnamed protein product [Protopolystoma xenopodis]|uniref:Uncharacterized protein n=1 Tax=Protopolystoma xenopodis TaxID=117903 RepID=A0A448WWY0_9PLAT|nr:unnamed protein product [Protopolystoma xenopodis]